ncbi:hypothetical protein EON64_14520 [archaeon]|nr:MAG: hypothetical protein EON64_14520 [archaeon]
MGYGQRGMMRSSEVSWTRICPLTDYCFEAVTNDIAKVKTLIDFPWDAYYKEFFVRSCGGDYGTKSLGYHPWRTLTRSARSRIGSVKINLTTPLIITGQGGTQELNLKYTCRKDLCVSKFSPLSSFALHIRYLICFIFGHICYYTEVVGAASSNPLLTVRVVVLYSMLVSTLLLLS